jgi:hypothetical protein
MHNSCEASPHLKVADTHCEHKCQTHPRHHAPHGWAIAVRGRCPRQRGRPGRRGPGLQALASSNARAICTVLSRQDCGQSWLCCLAPAPCLTLKKQCDRTSQTSTLGRSRQDCLHVCNSRVYTSRKSKSNKAAHMRAPARYANSNNSRMPS